MDDLGVDPPSWGTFLERYRAARQAAAATLSSAAPPNTSPSSAPSTPRRGPVGGAVAPPALSLPGSPAVAPAPASPSSAASPAPSLGSPRPSPRRVAVDKNVWSPVFHPLGRSVHTAQRYDGVKKPSGSGESTSELHDQQKLFPLFPQQEDE
ncbi:hypothetical protein BU14_1904s0001 [Porphyra umbilicalis]|uniref:Uncharacterized protein n=1 Tax=Porphyra umbilicalis TaxID=2786 RepID=A0A1X6NKK9_PORUM|nr:hypothetical protein BU14_1904s0001 [Porphyra umbilicalis]|eukprot:OSX69070.1 hypothetical protein BU14_1904s0001 [Porphyra umbilicalis]